MNVIHFSTGFRPVYCRTISSLSKVPLFTVVESKVTCRRCRRLMDARAAAAIPIRHESRFGSIHDGEIRDCYLCGPKVRA